MSGAPVLIGLDAGTSMMKAAAFTAGGAQIGVASRPNKYRHLPDGGAEQEMEPTWRDAAAVIAELLDAHPGLRARVVALAVTGQGDGCWLVDAAGAPVHDGWLWLDGRARDEARALAAGEAGRLVYETTGSGVNVCQMRSQLTWMKAHAPELLARAATALHPKDFLYLRLTGERATCPTEGVFTFGDFRTRAYSDAAIGALGLADLRHLLPPIVDGARVSHPLTAEAARMTGLPAGLPVALGYVDIVCTAFGGGLYEPGAAPGLTVLGSTGVHMAYKPNPEAIRFNEAATGYTMAFPDGGLAQIQTNMAATLNIDWLLDAGRELLAAEGVTRDRAALLDGLDAHLAAAKPGAALFHPYISAAGERGPFADPDARASFTGLSLDAGWFDMMRSVIEGLAFAAGDCYAAMGGAPEEIRLSGGAARSRVARDVLAAVLDRPVRVAGREEAGAAGAAMIAALNLGLYPDAAACAADWVAPFIGEAEAPNPELTRLYAPMREIFVETRRALAPVWPRLAAARRLT